MTRFALSMFFEEVYTGPSLRQVGSFSRVEPRYKQSRHESLDRRLFVTSSPHILKTHLVALRWLPVDLSLLSPLEKILFSC